MQAFIDKVVDNIGVEGTSYRYSASSHYLGAVISDLTAAEIASQNLNLIQSITYENSGSKAVLENAIKNKYFSNEVRDKCVG
ncbi:hypothetical protein OTUT144_1216 [Orientia tsutsugamushi str. UT144]|uniref:Uncharacterized protein n=1 Tax=Orientia tsutsugamushi str. UT144 TaxID=1441384 RepID=A0A0F3RK43_ORITS|nr:hypothetical protein [Orientia tsutsugamushi]KJW06750.1 hypothetical protein OTUT144_1216 [Orientia tsutsugamushi str. UT144]